MEIITLHQEQPKKPLRLFHSKNNSNNTNNDIIGKSKNSSTNSNAFILSEQFNSSYNKQSKLKPSINLLQSLDLKFPIKLQSHCNNIYNTNNSNNNEPKSQSSLYKKISFERNNNTSSSNYLFEMKEKKLNAEIINNRMIFLCSKINIQPTIEHLYRSQSQIISKSRINSPLPKKLKDDLIKTYKRLPFIYRNSTYNTLNKRPFSYYKRTKDDKRYTKPLINLDAIIQNYNANAKKSFTCEKVKMYQVKISPFLCLNGKM